MKDVYFFSKDVEEGFTINFCVKEIQKRGDVACLELTVLTTLNFLWNLKAPSNVIFFIRDLFREDSLLGTN